MIDPKRVVLSFVFILASQTCAMLFADIETISARIILSTLGSVFTWAGIWAAITSAAGK